MVRRLAVVAGADIEQYAYRRICHSLSVRLSDTEVRVGDFAQRADAVGFLFGSCHRCLFRHAGYECCGNGFSGLLRPVLLRLFTPRDTVESFVPAVRTMGISPFLKYLSFSVLVHHAVLLSIEFFSFAHLGTLLLRILSSSVLTVACVMAVEGIRKKR